MTDLPDPATDPAGFLAALMARAADAAGARALGVSAGLSVHDLGAVPQAEAAHIAGVQAAGARALAASLARGAPPLLLIASAGGAAETYARALETGLMGYERIFARIAAGVAGSGASGGGASGAVRVAPGHAEGGLALILILPPVEVNRYWSR